MCYANLLPASLQSPKRRGRGEKGKEKSEREGKQIYIHLPCTAPARLSRANFGSLDKLYDCVRVSFIGHQGPYRSVARSCCRCSDTLAKSLLLFHFVASCTLHLASAISAPFVHNSLISLFRAKHSLKRCSLICLPFLHYLHWSGSIHPHLSPRRAAVSTLRSWAWREATVLGAHLICFLTVGIVFARGGGEPYSPLSPE